jgi:molybdenum ABC transporter molybdate-binding protein
MKQLWKNKPLRAGFTLFFALSLSACSQSLKTDVISEFSDLNKDNVTTIALGNSDVPVGQYSEELLKNLGIWEDIQSKISFGSSVKEVLSQVELGSADCGIVYATDARTSDLVSVVYEAGDDLIQTPIVYPMGILTASQNKEATNLFYQFLFTEHSISQFKSTGFLFIQDDTATQTEPIIVEYPEDCTIQVFAAASLTEALTNIYEEFSKTYPNIEILFNFDSSGTLQTQIESGAEADLFISAAYKQMIALKDEGLVDQDSIVDLLENKVVLIVPKK